MNVKHTGFRCTTQWICCCSVARSCQTLSDSVDYSMTSLPVSHQLPEFAQVHVHWVSDAIQPFHLLLPSFLSASIFPNIRIFSNELSVRIMWPKYWCFSFSICPFNEYSRFISFKIDWFDLLAVQGTPKSSPAPHSSKASISECFAFFMVQLSHLYMTTGKTIALTIWTCVCKVIRLC